MDMRERKIKISNAILWLENLIENKVSKESKYQEYFEKNPIVFEVLGYTEFYPFTKQAEQRLPKDNYTDLQPEPDFIVKNNNGIFEIFEIKTPIDKNLSITRDPYRKRFTAEITSYIAQTKAYGDYFTRNPENRKTVEESYGIKIQEDMPQKIIIGLDKNIDKEIIHKLCYQYKDRIDIITYDHILKDLEREYKKHYGRYEGIPGCSIHAILKFDEKQENRRNYFLDIAGDIKKNRLSIYLNPSKELCFEVLSSNGKSTMIELDTNTIDIFDTFVYVSFEFGIFDQGFFFIVSINGKEVDQRIIYAPINIDFSHTKIFIGNDINLLNWSNFHLGRFAYYDHTNTHREQNHMSQEMRLPFQMLNFNHGSYLAVQSTPPMKDKIGNDIRPNIYYRLLAENKHSHLTPEFPPKFPYTPKLYK